MKMHAPMSTCFLLSLLVTSIPGCVALNIPSERHHDPDDRGGLFGPWASSHRHHETTTIVHDAQACSAGTACEIDGGPLQVDPFDFSVDAQRRPKPPEIPWPRFHPVPTRPVFGVRNL